jgi:exoribonuclease R
VYPGCRTDIPLFTVDPPTAVDLDQATYLARREQGGFRVYYAVADVAAASRRPGRGR